MTQVCLTAIVKNEAPTIVQTLESARQALGPGPTVIVDTGSDDGTPAVVQGWAQTSSRACVIVARPFDDFATSRNAALKFAFTYLADLGVPHDASLVCMVDAGVIVRGALDADWGPMTATIRLGSIEYPRPQIFTPGWHYVGKVHEYAEGPGELVPSGLTFSYELRDTERPRRWLRDLALLEEDFSPRGRFYYAQTLECLGRRSQALARYLERAAMTEGYQQERVIALIRCIPLATNFADAEAHAQAALQLDPSRGEAWLALARRAEDNRMSQFAELCAQKAILCIPRHGALFVDIDREWRANMIIGDAASSRGEFDRARPYWRRALELGGDRVPEDDRRELELALTMGMPRR